MLCSEHHSILPSYTIDLRTLTERVINIKDFHFLNGYNNPTVFFLYEPTPTWAGYALPPRLSLLVVSIVSVETRNFIPVSLSTPPLQADQPP